jgi:hypothetical protein
MKVLDAMPAAETTRSRFRKVLAGQMPEDRMPLVEWASWWNLTIDRWRREGLPGDLDGTALKRRFGLDVDYQHWFWGSDGKTRPMHEEPTIWIESADDYERVIRPHHYNVWLDPPAWRDRLAEQQRGDAVIWITVNGFFWWSRVLFGVEPHMYAFYDHPELMHRINQDQVNYIHRCLDRFTTEIGTPDFMTFAEDMSYNHGPMLSREQFDEFLAPYYRQVTPRLMELGIVPLVDSDGNVEPMIPWLESVGVDGILPLERMAGVDIARVRRAHPDWIMIGGFDKTVMHRGEEAIRGEFERLLPVMRSGRFVPSVDHQTPPEASIEQYGQYLRLLREYAVKAVQD